jgi:hypothetical protein
MSHSNAVVYERDILDEFAAAKQAPRYPSIEIGQGLLVEDRISGFTGDVVGWNHEAIRVRDRNNVVRNFTWKPGGFLLEGQPVTLVRPEPRHEPSTSRITNSGSIAGNGSPRVARASRIWVEGEHDAELVEHVWGDDLRDLGIVVEPMHGADDLVAAVAEFRPGPSRRLAIILDHLVTGSKETRLASGVTDPHVLITGHPFVDVWAGIRPRVLGIERWPDVPKGQPWKQGVCEALGVRLETFWPALRNRVSTYADLEPELVGAVERAIDFTGG